MTLREFFHIHPKVALAFSSGVDSSYLLYECSRYANDIRAYFVKTPFQPRFELEDALRMAKGLNVKLTIIEYDIIKHPEVMANGPLRCYYCKQKIFSTILNYAKKDGFTALIDGTNASDKTSDRPGMRALEEMNVLSPLRLCGLDKDKITVLSREAGLFTWNKPAYACLATRIPTGTAIENSMLELIEKSEDTLRSLGLRDFRLRISGRDAKLQVDRKEFLTVMDIREKILDALQESFSEITLDLKGR
ncbi:ATP-dependent sacrificial sulfur transferase LarE [Eubacteriales bacterium OttesenSCG-928-K08]|nr:ATP-dependent sacrificial sulfur transferase LarE [Eubacteriales bacterium OttesenSCG-928-K08]